MGRKGSKDVTRHQTKPRRPSGCRGVLLTNQNPGNMDKKTIKKIINFLKNDESVKKHAFNISVWRLQYTGAPSEIRAYWDNRNYNTARPAIKRLKEAHADKFERAGFFKDNAIAPYLSILLND